MLRKLALSLAIAGVLGIPNAHALGLGEINIRSALNEPLEAEIRLLQVRDLSPMQIQPRMADVDDFSLAGVTRSRFISDVRFQVNVFPDGTGVIRMTSSEPIREPFLNFLVEVNWPSGRLVREYTLLLDPPVFDPAPVARAVQPAVSTAPVPSVAVTPPQPAPAAPAPAPAPVAAPVAAAPSTIQTRAQQDTSQVYVGVRDTMWELALKHRPDSSITPQQMMLALQRKNPGSFPTGNVNMLKAGTVMEMPSLSEIRELTAQQANAEFARQTELWRQGRAAPRQAAAAAPAVDGSREEGKPEAQPETVADEASSELKIVTPPSQETPSAEERAVSTDQVAPEVTDPGEVAAESDAVADAADAPVQDQRLEQIDTRLVMTEESVDMLRRDNQDLIERVDAILEQLQLQNRLLELRDQQIAELQAELARRDAAPEPAAASGGSFMDTVDRFVSTVSAIPYIGPILGGLLALLLGLALLRRRKRAAADEEPGLIRAPKDMAGDKQSDKGAATAAVATAAAAGAAAASAQDATEEPVADEQPIVHQPLSAVAESKDEVDDLSDLDLDMDLDMPEPAAEEAADDVRVLDEEFDLSADDFSDLDDLDLSKTEDLELPAEETAVAEVAEQESDEEDLIAGLGLDEKGDDLDDLDELDFVSAADTTDADELSEELTEEEADSLFDLDFEDDSLSVDEPEADLAPVELEESELHEIDLEAADLEQEDDALDLSDLESDLMPDLESDLTVGEQALAGSLDEDLEEDLEEGLDDALDADLEGLLSEMDDEDASSLQKAAGAELSEDDVDEESLTLTLADDEDLESELDKVLNSASDAADDDEDLLGGSAFQLDEVGSDLAEEKAEEAAEGDEDFLASFEFDELEEDDEATRAVNDALSREADEPEADDIDSLLNSLEIEDDEPVQRKPRPGEVVEDELTANIAHDLELELDSELDDLLTSTDDDIAIEETDASESGSDDILEGLGLLDGADENETKLDLARAYIEMDDVEGARDILGEILREGNDQQREEAEELLKSLS